MKDGIYSLLKAKFLISDDALKNWKFIVFLVVLGMFAIANNHQYDAKNYRITELSIREKELRSEFVDRKSELAKLKKELQRVTEERDILKKAAVYFASQSK